MSETYHIAYLDDRDEAALSIIGPEIHDFNKAQAGENDYQPLCLVLRGPNDEILGGLVGETSWDWLHVDLLWLPEALRGQGYGQQLLTQAEEEARRRGVKNVYLDTFSFQAPDFYKQRGYQIFGQLDDFPPGHRRYFLKKRL